MKNRNLFERPHCREAWTYLVRGIDPWRYFGGRTWEIRLCTEHAESYGVGHRKEDSVGHSTVAIPRSQVEP